MYKMSMKDAEERSTQLYNEQLDAATQISALMKKIAHLYDEIHDDQDTIEAMKQVRFLVKVVCIGSCHTLCSILSFRDSFEVVDDVLCIRKRLQA